MKTKRRNLKAALTRFHNYVTEFGGSSDIGELKARLGKAEHLLNDFEKAQEQIECLEDSDDSGEQSEEFENSFFKITAKARKIIENCQVSSDSNNYIAPNRSSDQLIKLPTMHLPEFDGSYGKWILKELGLQGSKINMRVAGVDKSVTNISRQVTTEIRSRYNGFKRELTFLVLRDITGNVPINNIDISIIKIPEGIKLADQQFNVAGKIDVQLHSANKIVGKYVN